MTVFIGDVKKLNFVGEGFMIKKSVVLKSLIIVSLSLLSFSMLSGCATRCTDVGYVQPIGYYTYYPTGYMTQDIVVVGP